MRSLLDTHWPSSAFPSSFLSPEHLVILAISGLYLLRRQRTSRLSKAKLSKYADADAANVILPPHVTSYVPYLGSALEMSKGIRRFIAKYTAQFHHQPLFTATIAGDRCLFIGDPDHVTMVYSGKYAKHLDDYALQKQFTRNVLGVTNDVEEREIFSHLAKEANRQYHHYLFTDGELNKTVRDAQDIFGDILPQMVVVEGTSIMDGWQQKDLYRFVRDCVFKASVAPLISRHLATDEASRLYEAFDGGVPLMFGEAPSFLVGDAAEARTSLIDIISDDRFVEQGSDLMKARTGLNFSRNVFVRSALGLLFASVGNSIPAVFWCLYHIIADSAAYQAIRAEVDGIVESRKTKNSSADATLGSFSLGELDRMVLVKSSFNEALRLYHGAFTTREATEDFVFDPKKPGGGPKYLIEKGTRVMAFPAVIHHNEGVFDEAEKYRYDRFAPIRDANGRLQERTFTTKDGRKVAKPLVAFGGGNHLCPGRKFISYETQAFVAVLISMFDMRLVCDGDVDNTPKIDYPSQGVGVSHPIRDIKVELRPRER